METKLDNNVVKEDIPQTRNLFPISEVFTSPQGEGVYAGTMMTFIRLAGCTVGKRFPKEMYLKAKSLEQPNYVATRLLPIYTEQCTLYDGRKFPCFLSSEAILKFTDNKYLRHMSVGMVKEGDILVSWSKKGVVEGKVKRVEHRWVDESELMTVTVQRDDGFGIKHHLVVTKNHEFLSTGLDWIKAEDLTLGCLLQRVDGIKNKLARLPTIRERMSLTRRKRMASGDIECTSMGKDARKIASIKMIESNPMADPKVVIKARKTREKNKFTFPSGAERKVQRLAEVTGVDLKFVGNGKYFVTYNSKVKNPDFIIPGTKKLVEVYDSSFHYTGHIRNGYWGRKIKTFYGKAGYECLPIDVHKLTNDQIKEKLFCYSGNGLQVVALRDGFYGNPSKWKTKTKRGNKYCLNPTEVIKVDTEGKRKFKVTEIEIDNPHNYIGPAYTINHNCDTDYRKHERLSIDQLLALVPEKVEYVCITGGEPLMHNLNTLITYLWSNHKKIHIETSGTIDVHFNQDTWITVSPKFMPYFSMIKRANELKILVDDAFNPQITIPTLLSDGLVQAVNIIELAKIKPVYLQPVNHEFTINGENLKLCNMWQKKYPQLRVCLQLHKALSTLTGEHIR